MPPRRKLSDLDRGRAIGWLQDGVAARQVAQRLAVAPSVIIRLKQRFHATGRVQERSGRPRVTTQREDRFIQRQAMQQRTATANNIRQRLQATVYFVYNVAGYNVTPLYRHPNTGPGSIPSFQDYFNLGYNVTGYNVTQL
ncbi:hypothetical protein V1264_015283 [Littorina saxatilis]|uniref:Paired domain-containing protein n=1 Tax=Littorina saxatilis TaxID=31220 RepID=A0AAN9BL35_9CAEN